MNRGGTEVGFSSSSSSHITIFKDLQTCIGSTQIIEPPVTIDAGEHVYPFSFRFPALNLPSSFEGVYGRVRYELAAVIVRPGHANRTTFLPLTVPSTLDSTDSIYNEPVVSSLSKGIGRWMWKQGPVDVKISIPREAYASGKPPVRLSLLFNHIHHLISLPLTEEIIPIQIDIINQSGSFLELTDLKLKQKAVYKSSDEIRGPSTEKIHKLNYSEIFPPHIKRISRIIQFPVPPSTVISPSIRTAILEVLHYVSAKVIAHPLTRRKVVDVYEDKSSNGTSMDYENSNFMVAEAQEMEDEQEDAETDVITVENQINVSPRSPFSQSTPSSSNLPTAMNARSSDNSLLKRIFRKKVAAATAAAASVAALSTSTENSTIVNNSLSRDIDAVLLTTSSLRQEPGADQGIDDESSSYSSSSSSTSSSSALSFLSTKRASSTSSPTTTTASKSTRRRRRAASWSGLVRKSKTTQCANNVDGVSGENNQHHDDSNTDAGIVPSVPESLLVSSSTGDQATPQRSESIGSGTVSSSSSLSSRSRALQRFSMPFIPSSSSPSLSAPSTLLTRSHVQQQQTIIVPRKSFLFSQTLKVQVPLIIGGFPHMLLEVFGDGRQSIDTLPEYDVEEEREVEGGRGSEVEQGRSGEEELSSSEVLIGSYSTQETLAVPENEVVGDGGDINCNNKAATDIPAQAPSTVDEGCETK